MSNALYLKMEVFAGSHISSAIRDALDIARRIGSSVAFTHNGIDMVVSHSDSFREKLAEWNRRFSAQQG